MVALVHAYWTARRRRVAGWSRKLLLLLAPPLLAVPASAAAVLAAFARLHKMCKFIQYQSSTVKKSASPMVV